jgi:thiocyanate hydrolase subunit beta
VRIVEEAAYEPYPFNRVRTFAHPSGTRGLILPYRLLSIARSRDLRFKTAPCQAICRFEKRRFAIMASRSEVRQQLDIIGSLQPAIHVPENWNYEVSSALYRAYMHPPHDVGGQPDVPVHYEEKEEEQWELNTYVTCEVLGWRGVWTAEERRRRADNDLGYTLYLGLPYYGRWIWSAARMLVDKKHISLTELLEKIAEVKSRYEAK